MMCDVASFNLRCCKPEEPIETEAKHATLTEKTVDAYQYCLWDTLIFPTDSKCNSIFENIH